MHQVQKPRFTSGQQQKLKDKLASSPLLTRRLYRALLAVDLEVAIRLPKHVGGQYCLMIRMRTEMTRLTLPSTEDEQ